MIVADASPLIFLARVELLPALTVLFGQIMLPPQVFAETSTDVSRPGARSICDAVTSGLLHVVAPTHVAEVARLAESVDAVEAAAIALALELGSRGILIDDAAGRRLAETEGLLPVGTLGVLIRGARRGVVEDPVEILARLEVAGLRIDATVRRRVLESMG